MSYVLLAFAIVAEVVATTSLKLAEGFSRLVPSVLVVVGYGSAFFLMSQALARGIPLGVAYGIWAAAGVALVAVVGALFLGEGMTWVQAGGIAFVIAGVWMVEWGATQ
jgi:small multidrug resistance pump